MTFVSDRWVTEYMHLFTARTEEDPTVVCDEGDLEWVDKDKVQDLPIWRGDKIFLDLLAQNVPFFLPEAGVCGGHPGAGSAQRERTSHPGMTPAQLVGKPA